MIIPMKTKKNVVVIGAGLSGLSAGIYLTSYGFNVTLLERNPSVGGLCTGWKRQGFNIDGCIHWLTGTKDDHTANHIWKDIGGFENDNDLIYLDTWGDYDYLGTKVRFLRDYKKAEQEWLAIAPEDKKQIKKFFRMVEAFINVNLPMDQPPSMLPINAILKLGFDVVRHPSFLWTMHISTDEYANRFKNPAIRWAIKNVQPGRGNLFSMIFSYATIAGNSGAVPIGGSKALVERIKNKYLSLGGELVLNADVEDIEIENGKAVSVILTNGKTYPCDYVVSAIDPNYMLRNILKGHYQVKQITKRAEDYKKYPTISSCLITYTIEDVGELSTINAFPIKPIKVGNSNIDFLDIRNYNYDPKTFVVGNKTVCHTQIHQFDEDYLKWEQLYLDKAIYRKEKERIAKEVVDRIETQYPQYKGKINVLDIFTPITLRRYTNVNRGAYMSLFTHDRKRLSYDGHINGLENIFLASQWMLSPGGAPYAIATGKYAALRICKREKIKVSTKYKKLLSKATQNY